MRNKEVLENQIREIEDRVNKLPPDTDKAVHEIIGMFLALVTWYQEIDNAIKQEVVKLMGDLTTKQHIIKTQNETIQKFFAMQKHGIVGPDGKVLVRERTLEEDLIELEQKDAVADEDILV